MSNIYIQEPSTEGKVLVVTSAGEFDVELWSKETPKTCKNFVQLCLEGYYIGSVFHRVIPGFIAQGGDPTGTGTGGESIYGKPFKDEFHTRLRFVRRGLVAMANAGAHDNGSQFFFTLGQASELQNKHTIFGKITGDTIFNLSRFEDGIINKNDRPEYPHKILRIEVLKNPFPDIVPRVKIQNEILKADRKAKKRGTKNFKLLSFGDEAEEEEEEVKAATKKFYNRGNSAHDIARDPTLSASTGKEEKAADEAGLERIRKKFRKEDSAAPNSNDTILNEISHEVDVREESGNNESCLAISRESESKVIKKKYSKEESATPNVTEILSNEINSQINILEEFTNQETPKKLSSDSDLNSLKQEFQKEKAVIPNSIDIIINEVTPEADITHDVSPKDVTKLDVSPKDVTMSPKDVTKLDVSPKDVTKLATKESELKLAEMRAEIKQLKRELIGGSKKVNNEVFKENEIADVALEDSEALREYKCEKLKYLEVKQKLPKKGAGREDMTLALLKRFTNKVHKVVSESTGDKEEPENTEDENDESWIKHKLQFESQQPVVAKDASTKDDQWYDVSDPRNAITKRRREHDAGKSKTSKK